MTALSKIRGLFALILIVALFLVSMALPRVPKRIAWAVIAAIAVIAAWNEWGK